jgi:hypothetical protein
MSGLTLSPAEKDTFRIVMAVRQLIEGRSNATGTFTLATSPATSTVVAAPTCGAGSIILLMPQTANSAAALAATFVAAANVTKGQFIVTHSTSSQTDRTFGYVALG